MNSHWTLWHTNPTYLTSFIPTRSVFECGEQNIYSQFLLLLWCFSPFSGHRLSSAGVSRQLSFCAIRMSASFPGRQRNLSLSSTLLKTCPVWVAPPAAMLQLAQLSSLESKLTINSEKTVYWMFWKWLLERNVLFSPVHNQGYMKTNKMPADDFSQTQICNWSWKTEGVFLIIAESIHFGTRLTVVWPLKLKVK
jgi:hypothetical protein